MTKIELKPCPFCGERKIELDKPDLLFYGWFCQCPNCKATIAYNGTRESAIEKWNHRAPEWFPVDKVLPPKEMHVLGFDKKRQRNYTNLYFYPDTQEFRDDMYPGKPVSITHWMAYPDAPKEEQGDE